MELNFTDWAIIGIFFFILLSIGWIASKTAGKDITQYFLGGRGMTWWLLGISMVACTFSTDVPNLVTGMVRENGVAKNWAWWAFLITGLITVFIYAKLWRRSNIMTDLEFYELRYSGKAASFLRGFRAVYLGLFFNCLIMGTVTLAAIKIGAVLLGLKPWVTIIGGSIVVVIYAGLGGLKGVIWADFFQYGFATLGSIIAAVTAVHQPEIGNLKQLLSNPAVKEKMSFIPDFTNPSQYVPLLIIPIAVQWWAVWYPGAEPGGGGYIAQRMLAAKNEKNAIGATMLFNVAHYALRPWPWIVVALASIVVFPDLASIKASFPSISMNYLKDDIAYPVMLTRLEHGWMGLVVASLIAAYMSTIGTHLNWGSSYLVNDFYKRFIHPSSGDKTNVAVGRVTTLLLMILAGLLSLYFLQDATQAFNILILSGAGSGLIYLLRWFWWRINAWTEVVAMIVATLTGIILVFFIKDQWLAETFGNYYPLPAGYESFNVKALSGVIFPIKLIIAIICTTIAWIITMFLTKPVKKNTLIKFYHITQPGGPGWKRIVRQAEDEGLNINERYSNKNWEMPIEILCVFIGCFVIYSILFSIGSFLYQNYLWGWILAMISLIGMIALFKLFSKLRAD